MSKCYIFDIDGTLADGTHRLHHIQKTPKDWTAFFAECGEDKPINHMLDLAWQLQNHAKIVYVSGRSEECRNQTIQWLAVNKAPHGPVYMRKAEDHQDDDKLKIEMLADIRADGYEPIMAFDDRNRVVRAWRDAGIPCLQVADGDF